jgi:hypothetical protein
MSASYTNIRIGPCAVFRRVPTIETGTPGLVITPACNAYGSFEFKNGCCITHEPSGWRLAGVFQDVGIARSIARVLGGLLLWDDRNLADPESVVAAVKSATRNSPQLLEWIAKLNEWEQTA